MINVAQMCCMFLSSSKRSLGPKKKKNKHQNNNLWYPFDSHTIFLYCYFLWALLFIRNYCTGSRPRVDEEMLAREFTDLWSGHLETTFHLCWGFFPCVKFPPAPPYLCKCGKVKWFVKMPSTLTPWRCIMKAELMRLIMNNCYFCLLWHSTSFIWIYSIIYNTVCPFYIKYHHHIQYSGRVDASLGMGQLAQRSVYSSMKWNEKQSSYYRSKGFVASIVSFMKWVQKAL